jgi:2-dehydropantoate 2-reductase
MIIKNIYIVGAGAMGTAYASMFLDAEGFSVSFVAKGDRLRRLNQNPLTVNGKSYSVPAIQPDQAVEPADLILVALKYHHLKEALGDIAALAGENSLILSVMNGLDSEELIGAICGAEKIVHAIAVAIDAVREDAQTTYSTPGKIIFGQVHGGAGDEDLELLEEALIRANIPYEISKNIMRSIWEKFMVNVGLNQASAVLGASYGVFQTNSSAKELTMMLMREVIALAQKTGIDLIENDMGYCDRILAKLSPEGKTSMLQDIEAGRKTEVEMFAGKVVSLGNKYQIPTPINGAILRIINVLETIGRR